MVSFLKNVIFIRVLNYIYLLMDNDVKLMGKIENSKILKSKVKIEKREVKHIKCK